MSASHDPVIGTFHFDCFIFYVVLKLLKTAEGIRSLLDTVGKALPQVSIRMK